MNKQEQLQFIENNYSLYTTHTSKRRIRHDFFKNICTELQAYLLGFYAADGSIDEKRKTLRIHLSNKDVEIVYLYKDIISPDARLFSIKSRENNTIRKYPIIDNGSTGVDITSAILVLDLVSLNIGYRKTYSDWEFPSIPKLLLPHFVRGYIDGDGAISGYIAKERTKRDRFRILLLVDAKLESVINNLVNFFYRNNIKVNKMYLKRDNMWRMFTSSKEEMVKIFNLIYKDSHFYLSRKFEKFKYYVNTEMVLLLADHCNALEMK